jgi:hypothetical protein
MQLLEHHNRTARAAAACLAAWIDRHQTLVDTLRHPFSFALLFCASAHATYHSALAEAARGACGAMCLAMPGYYFLAAAACGGVAILAAMAYATSLHAFQRRPDFKRADLAWFILGIVLMSFDALWSAHGFAREEFLLGWLLGGSGVLDFFWSKFAIKRGTEPWHRHGIVPEVRYTDGAKYAADHAGANWLLDEIALAQRGDKAVAVEAFQLWKLTVQADHTATLVCEDRNGNAVYSKAIPYTDFPLPEIALFFTDGLISLPGER